MVTLENCPRLCGTRLRYVKGIRFDYTIRGAENSRAYECRRKRNMREDENDVAKARMGKIIDFLCSLHILEDDFSHLDDPFSHTPVILDTRE